MKVAVEGCCHGELDAIYETLELLQKKNNYKVDLLLICGDFQAVRNKADLECMAVPPKHRKMNSFYKYYSGEKVAPVLTVFIGGNHEASNYLQSLPYGGWVAPKIYYMGYAGVVQFGGVRIGGMSGIFKGKDFLKGHFEHPPYSEDTKRSVYHLRTIDVFRLKQLKQHVDIFLSHDWPRGIHKYGNVQQLLRRKKFFAEEIEKDILGNPVAMDLMLQLQPSYWFAAHLHVKFPALVQHSQGDDGKLTKFLSLDKCLPRRHFLQVLDIPHDPNKPLKLELDAEWLSILKLTNHLLNLSRSNHYPANNPQERSSLSPSTTEIKSLISDFGGDLTIPENFEMTVPAFNPAQTKNQNKGGNTVTEINPQTTLLCSMLDLTNPNAVFLGRDSTFNLPNDPEDAGQDEADNEKGDDVDDEDYESEQSFFSLSESDRSFSDRSFSFLSTTGNESGLLDESGSLNSSVGYVDEIPNDSKKEEGGSDQSKMSLSLNRSLSNTSLSEKLKNVPELVKSNSATSESSSVEDEEELAEILKAQKSINIVEGEKHVSDSSLNESSIDCRDLDINDDDPELLEMLKAQKSQSDMSGSGDIKSLGSKEKCLIEASLDNDDIEFQGIMSAQKNSQSGIQGDIQSEFLDLKPAYQSSPLPSVEDREQNQSSKDLSPRFHMGGKRGEVAAVQEQSPIQSPVTKKFKRRNQDMYSDNSTGEEDAT